MSAKMKKLITLNEFELLTNLVRDESQSGGITDSEQIEQILVNHYLNEDRDLSYAVRKLLFCENGISRSLAYIFGLSNKLSGAPKFCVSSLLDFVYTLEMRYRTTVKDVADPRIQQLIKLSGQLSHIVKPVDEFYTFTIFKNISEMADEIDAFNTGTEFAQVFKIMKQLWDVPIPSKYPGGLDIYLCDLQVSYDIMRLICELSTYPICSEYRTELVRLFRKFKFE